MDRKLSENPNDFSNSFDEADYENFYDEICQELISLGESETEAEKKVTEFKNGSEGFKRPESSHRWLLFHESPEHWAKIIFYGHYDYWRIGPRDANGRFFVR
jgi:hypothetical protein